MRKIQFANGYLYHIYNRGTEKRNIFLEDADYFRFIHDLYEFNNINPSFHLGRRDVRGDVRGLASDNLVGKKKRELLVEIITFCLMPNHFHFILKQVKDGGIAKFMQKFGTGYAMYFNKKNQRTGSLFQGSFKAILVEHDRYFLPLLNYIHLNPVELIEPRWKEGGIKDRRRVSRFLENYRWSSYNDYIGIKNFPSVINDKFLKGYFKDKIEYKNFINQQLIKDIDKDMGLIKGKILE